MPATTITPDVIEAETIDWIREELATLDPQIRAELGNHELVSRWNAFAAMVVAVLEASEADRPSPIVKTRFARPSHRSRPKRS